MRGEGTNNNNNNSKRRQGRHGAKGVGAKHDRRRSKSGCSGLQKVEITQKIFSFKGVRPWCVTQNGARGEEHSGGAAGPPQEDVTSTYTRLEIK